MQFLQHHRIERAKLLLLSDEDYSIGEIAQVLAFSDIYHFSKTFKKQCGLSPSQFAEQRRAQSPSGLIPPQKADVKKAPLALQASTAQTPNIRNKNEVSL